jgi:hypothetical protein
MELFSLHVIIDETCLAANNVSIESDILLFINSMEVNSTHIYFLFSDKIFLHLILSFQRSAIILVQHCDQNNLGYSVPSTTYIWGRVSK